MKRANGTGSITKLDGNRRKPWRVRIHLKNAIGRSYRVDLGCFRTKREAVEALAAYQTNPRDLSFDKLTFKDIYEKWAEYEFPMLTGTRQAVYVRCFNRCASIHSIKFRQLRHTDFSRILDENTYSIGVEIKNLYSKISKFALKNDIIEKDYSQFLESRKKHEPKRIKEIFSSEEIQKLWDNLYKYKEIDTTLVLIYTGLRIGELMGLKRENIDWETMSIKGAGIKTEAGKKRVIPIHSKITPLLLNRFKDTQEGYLFEFPGETSGAKQMYYKRVLRKISKELGLQYHTAHDCRHTFATLLNDNDANSTAIKDLMGHASFDVSERVYTHKGLEELRKAIEKIN